MFGRPAWPDPFGASRAERLRSRGASPLEQAAAYIRQLEAEVRDLRRELSGRDRALVSRERELAGREQELTRFEQKLAILEQRLASREREADVRERELSAREQELEQRALAPVEEPVVPPVEPERVPIETATAPAAEPPDQADEQEFRVRQLERAVVDAQNELEAAKDRIRRESARDLEQKKRAVLTRFLPVLDDLDRALAAAREHRSHDSLVAGVELVRRNFLAVLEEYGVRHDPAQGAVFDPNRHQAVGTVDDGGQPGTVAAVVREGYRIGDETLRPATVVVRRRAE